MLRLPRTDRAWIVACTGTYKGVSTHGQPLRLFIRMLSGVECAAALLKLFPASAKPLRNFRGRLPRSPFWASAKLRLFPFRVGCIAKLYIMFNFREVAGAFRKEAVRSFGTACLNACPDVSLAHRDNDSESHVATHIAISLIGECSCVRPMALGRLKGQLCDYSITEMQFFVACRDSMFVSRRWIRLGDRRSSNVFQLLSEGGSLPGRLGTFREGSTPFSFSTLRSRGPVTRNS